MTSYVDLIKQVILTQLERQNTPSARLIRIEGIPHPEVYWEVATFFDNWAHQRGLKFVAKLAYNKYVHFCETCDTSGLNVLNKMVDAGYVDRDNHMTHWRNKAMEDGHLAILMGTESVEDQGGLSDFFAITPEYLDQVLSGDYATWFEKLVADLADDERQALNNVVQEIFRVSTRNLFRLSKIVDDLAGTSNFYDASTLIAHLFDRLFDDWGLPCVKTVPDIRLLRRPATCRQLFDELARFRDRQVFRDMPASRRTRLIEAIRANTSVVVSNNQIPGYASMEDLKADLVQYIVGENVDIIRPRILRCDYSLIRDILALKRSRKENGRVTAPKFHGPPMKAFLDMVINVLAEEVSVTSIQFALKEARLAGCNTDDDVRDHWDRIRLLAGGLLDFLNAEFAATCDLELAWVDNLDPFRNEQFDRLHNAGLIEQAAASRKLSAIELTVRTSNGNAWEYVWEFAPNEPWLYTFFHVLHGLFDTYQNQHGSKYLPIVRVSRFSDLLMSNNEDEFFSRLETSVTNYRENVVTYIRSKLAVNEHAQLIQKIEQLGEHFTQFLEDVTEFGFYGSFTGQCTSTLRFIQSYCELIEWIGLTPLTSAARAVLPTLANAFLIIDDKHDISLKGLSGAVVLPVHPAMLEKLVDQALFIRQGATEVIRYLRNTGTDTERAIQSAQRRLKTFEQLSTISLAVDVLWSSKPSGYLSVAHTFGTFAIYREADTKPTGISLSNIITDEVAGDEEIPARELLRQSPISDVIYSKLASYLRTFPSQADGLHVLFVNPPDLQPVVAGIHQLIESLKDQANESKVRIQLTILAPTESLGGRSYLHYWVDNFFADTDTVDVSTYFKVISFSGKNLGTRVDLALRTMPEADVTFVQNIMDVTEIHFEETSSKGSPPVSTRFPMVLHPLPVFRTSAYRRTSISQLQFQASSAHARLVYYLSAPMNRFLKCQVVNQLQLQPHYEELLRVLHERSRWVVCIDPGIDREVMAGPDHRIISFSTGQGPFGELNVTVSSRRESTVDIRTKLESRLRSLFSGWSDEALQVAAERCLSHAERLDGAHILRALNPDDYQLHNFLSYLLTAQYLKVDAQDDSEVIVRTLIPLDSYDHWFRPDVDPVTGGSASRPDFLLLEVRRQSADDPLKISATVIECKMGRCAQSLVEDGLRQLEHGIRVLRAIWNPQRDSIDRRYWYSQLYRALIFATVNMAENDPAYLEFSRGLDAVLDGHFSISWKGLLLTYWLDSDAGDIEVEKVALTGCPDVPAEQHAFSQLVIQRMLIDDESEVQYMPLRADRDMDAEGKSADDGAEYVTTAPSVARVTASETIMDLAAERREQYTPSTAQVSTISEVQNTELSIEVDARDTSSGPFKRTPLEQVRLLIGEDVRNGEPVYWEFGHPELQNRHVLITGTSGTGKTYFIQALLLELSQYGISSLIFDYTDGFTLQKLEPDFVRIAKDRIMQLPIYHQPFPLNPFKRYRIEVAGELILQKPVDVAERIKSSLAKVFDLGPQQANAVYNAVKAGMEKYGSKMTLARLGEELRKLGESLSNARTALTRLEPLIDRDPFDHDSSQDWSILERNPGCIVVIQLSGFTRDVQVAITQLILWDAWYYNVQHGHKDKPFPVILDEAQNLDHSESSPTALILTEGRKFGWSGWFATQFLRGQMEKDELGRLQQASQKIFFRPPESELRNVALMIDPDRSRAAEWEIQLARLQKGYCVVSGWTVRNGRLVKDRPRIVRITPLSSRGGLR